MLAPAMLPSGANIIRTNLPKRLELLLRCVWVFPNASNIGLACKIWRSRSPSRPFAVKWEALPDKEGDIATPLRTELLRGRPEDGIEALNEEEKARVFERECDGVEGA